MKTRKVLAMLLVFSLFCQLITSTDCFLGQKEVLADTTTNEFVYHSSTEPNGHVSPAAAFTSITIKPTISESGDTIDLGITATLNKDELEDISGEFEDYAAMQTPPILNPIELLQTCTDTDYTNFVGSPIVPIEFSIPLDETVFRLENIITSPIAIEGVEVGKYEVVADVNAADELRLNVLLYPRIYTYGNAGIRFNFGVSVNAEGNNKATMTLNELGRLTATFSVDYGSASVEQQLEDKAPNTSNELGDRQVKLQYKATALAPTGNSLANWKLQYTNNAMEVRNGTAVFTFENTSTEIVRLATDYAFDVSLVKNGSVFTYTVPNDRGQKIKKVELTYDVWLNQAEYEKYMLRQANNVAQHKMEMIYDGQTRASSSTITTSYRLDRQEYMRFIDKQQFARVGSNFTWKTFLQTHFLSEEMATALATTQTKTVYLLNIIEDNTKEAYTSNSAVTVQYSTDTTNAKTYTAQEAIMTPSAITANELKAVTANGTQSVYFTIGTKSYLVVPLPLDKLVDAIGKSSRVTVTHKSDALLSGAVDDKIALSNVSCLVWEGDLKYGSDGSYQTDWTPSTTNGQGFRKVFDDFKLDFDVSIVALGKSEYKQQNQLLKWIFNVNNRQDNLTELIFEQKFDKKEVKLWDAFYSTPSPTIQLVPADGEGATLTLISDSALANANTYRISQDETHNFITLRIEAIAKQYNVTIETRLTNPVNLAEQNIYTVSKQSSIISASAIDVVPENSRNQTGTAIADVSSSHIGASSLGYDFESKATNWRVELNFNKYKIDAPYVLIELPTGADFGKIVSVKKNQTAVGSAASDTEWNLGDDTTIKAENKVIGTTGVAPNVYAKNTIRLNFSEASITDHYEIVFSTPYEDEYKIREFPNDSFTNLTNNTFCTATMNGIVATSDDPTYTRPIITDLNSNRKAIVGSQYKITDVFTKPATKTGAFSQGVYNQNGLNLPKAAWVSWTLIVNTAGYNAENLVIQDNLLPAFELVENSLKMYTVDAMSTTGVPTLSSELSTIALEKSYNGFSYTVPAEFSRKALCFKFDTLVTDEPEAETGLTNEVVFGTYSKKSANPTGSENFSFSAFASGQQSPYVQVYTTSTNTTYSPTGIPQFRLGGVKVELQKMVWQDPKWVPTTTKSKTTGNKPNSNSKGKTSYLFLEKGVLYCIKAADTENGIPSEYETPEPRYIFFDNGSTPNNLPTGTNIVTSGFYGLVVLTAKPDKGGDAFTFTVTSENDVPIGGIPFTISASNLANITRVSDLTGIVDFGKLDPGNYTLKEESGAPNIFKKAGTFAATIGANTTLAPLTQSTSYTVVTTQQNTIIKKMFDAGTVELSIKDNQTIPADVSALIQGNADFAVFPIGATSAEKLTTSPVAFMVYNSGKYVLSKTSGALTAEEATATNEFGAGIGAFAPPYLTAGNGLLSGKYQIENVNFQAATLIANQLHNEIGTKLKVTVNNDAVTSTVYPVVKINCTITGTVKNTNGDGLQGAVLGIYPNAATTITNDQYDGTNNGTPIATRAVATTISDGNGDFKFMRLPPGSYKVGQITQPTGFLSNTTLVTAAPSYTNPTESVAIIDLYTGGITGNILEETTHQPFVGLTVALYDVTGQISLNKTATTDATGVYTISDLAPGVYTVKQETAAPKYVTAIPQQATVTSDFATVDFRNSLIPGKISGYVLDRYNHGVGGAVVELKKNGNVIDTETTSANGAYSFIQLSAGEYMVSQSTTVAPFAIDTKIYTLTVVKTEIPNNNFLNVSTVNINGTIKETGTGKTLDFATVALYAPTISTSALETKRITSATGIGFSFTNVPKGNYVVKQVLPVLKGYIADEREHGVTVNTSDVSVQLESMRLTVPELSAPTNMTTTSAMFVASAKNGSYHYNVKVSYRKFGSTTWEILDEKTNQTTYVYNASPTGLTPSTIYEYCIETIDVTAHSKDTQSIIKQFMTSGLTVPTGSIKGEAEIENAGVGEKITVSVGVGNIIIDTVEKTTNASGSIDFEFNGLEDGIYNVVADNGTDEGVTESVTVTNGKTTSMSPIRIMGSKAARLVVKGNDTPAISVARLGEYINKHDNNNNILNASAEDTVSAGGFLLLELIAEKKEETEITTQAALIDGLKGNQTIGLYIDFTVEKTLASLGENGKEEPVFELPWLASISMKIPQDLLSKTDFRVYRVHDGVAQKIDNIANTDGECVNVVQGGKWLEIKVKKFSVYAIGYSEPSVPPPNTEDASDDSDKNDSRTVSKTPTTTVAATTSPAAMEVGKHIMYTRGYPGNIYLPERFMTRAECVLMLAQLTAGFDKTAVYKSNYQDVPLDKWYTGAIGFMQARKMLIDFDAPNFKPNEPMTRGEFAMLAARFDSLKFEDSVSFKDVPLTHKAAGAISAAVKKGWITGYPDKTFAPDSPIKRSEVIRLTNKVLNRFTDKSSIEGMNIHYFDDVHESHWAFYEILESTQTHDFMRPSGTAKEKWQQLLPENKIVEPSSR